MKIAPVNERPTAQQLAAQASGQPAQIAGKPADVCPYCGCAMFVNGTPSMQTEMIYRYEVCRNPNCRRRFLTKQLPPPQKVFVKEVKPREEEFSSDGNAPLTVYRDAV